MTENAYTLELFKTGLVVVTLLLTWIIGQRFIAYWDIRKKSQEIDLSLSSQLHQLYGEFKEVSKLWRLNKQQSTYLLTPPDDLQWSLLVRACEAESKSEAIIVKLATERVLSANDIKQLGLFRQAVQTLRESIRAGAVVPASDRGNDYVFFNLLTTQVATIITTAKKRQHSKLQTTIDQALSEFRAIPTGIDPILTQKPTEDTLFELTNVDRFAYEDALNQFAVIHQLSPTSRL